MTEKQHHKSASDQGIDWFTRLQSGEADADDYKCFACWQDEDPANRQAFDEIGEIWRQLDELKDELYTGQQQSPQSGVMPDIIGSGAWHGRLKSAPWGRLLGIMFLCISVGALWQPQLVQQLASDYRVGTGEQKQITLADGSQVLLDAQTSLSVDYSDRIRQLTLHYGRAYFTVAKDAQRPFVVKSGTTQVRALGTEFEVNVDDDDVAVTVFESAVQVSHDQHREKLIAGEGLYYSPQDGITPPYTVNLQQAAAWQRGRLVFSARPLEQVVAEINRYRHGRVVIMDESLLGLPVSGVIDLGKPDSALQAIVEALPVKQHRFTPYLILLSHS